MSCALASGVGTGVGAAVAESVGAVCVSRIDDGVAVVLRAVDGEAVGREADECECEVTVEAEVAGSV